jgi:hypothetical protein
MENTQSKGMSKGCLVTLIIAGVLVVVLAILLMLGWVYKDDLARMGGTALVNGLKTDLATHEYESVDTVQFNAIADAFLDSQEQDSILNLESYGRFMESLQIVMGDEVFDEDEVPVIIDAFIEFYPALEELRPGTVPEEVIIEEEVTAETIE